MTAQPPWHVGCYQSTAVQLYISLPYPAPHTPPWVSQRLGNPPPPQNTHTRGHLITGRPKCWCMAFLQTCPPPSLIHTHRSRSTQEKIQVIPLLPLCLPVNQLDLTGRQARRATKQQRCKRCCCALLQDHSTARPSTPQTLNPNHKTATQCCFQTTTLQAAHTRRAPPPSSACLAYWATAPHTPR